MRISRRSLSLLGIVASAGLAVVGAILFFSGADWAFLLSTLSTLFLVLLIRSHWRGGRMRE